MDKFPNPESIQKQNQTLTKALAIMSVKFDTSIKILSAISSLTAVPLEDLNPNQAFERVLVIILEQLDNVEACSILMFDAQSEELKLLAARGQSDLLEELNQPKNKALSFKPGQGVAGTVFSKNTPLFFDPEEPDDLQVKLDKNLNIPKSLASFPLTISDTPIGVINISFGVARPFDQTRRRDLMLLANVVANVVQTSLLKIEVRENAANKLQETVLKLEKEVEEKKKVQLSLQLTQFIVDSSSDAAFWIKTDGGFAYVNEAACKSLGYEQDELLSMSIHDIDPNIPPEVWTEHWEDLRSRKRIEAKSQYRTKDGRVFPVAIKISHVEFEGEEYNCIFARDVTKELEVETEMKNLQVQLQQKQKLEALGTLAGGIAHDFNNILAGIMGYTQLASLDIPEGHPSKNNLLQAIQGGERAKGLVQQMLNFARPTGQEKRPLLLESSLKDALTLLRASLPATLEIRQNIRTESDFVLADPTQFHQVMLNLCTNASQAMRESGGILTVSLVKEELDQRQASLLDLVPGEYLKLGISDTGPGMSMETQDRIFEPFFTTKGPGEGSGMGLAVVYGIVKNHDGVITVQSELEKGTTFEIYLPVVNAPKDEVRIPTDDTSLPRGSERILFVDDEKPITETGQAILEHFGYSVTGLTSSREALDLFQGQPDSFDLVITDMTMPDLTGFDLAKKLMDIRPDIPIILCTGYSEQVTSKKIKALGIKRLLAKPLTIKDVTTAVRTVLDENA